MATSCSVTTSGATTINLDSSCVGTGGLIVAAPSDFSGQAGAPDYALMSTDNALRGVVSQPDGVERVVHNWNVGPAQCTGVFEANCTGTVCETTVLPDAFEILQDGVGNDNGPCESDEACVYMPNISHYQGHGGLSVVATLPGSFPLTNVTLYAYDTNGI